MSKVNVFVEGRLLEDDGNVLISLEDNIEGNLMTSQEEALKWDKSFLDMNDPSGRSIKKIHKDSY